MKHNKLLLGLLSTGIVAGSIPLISLTGCSSPKPQTEWDIDDSYVYKTLSGYVETSESKQGACYVSGFKLSDGQQISDLSARVVNLQGMEDTAVSTEIVEIGYNFFTVNVYFASKNVLSSQTAKFDIILSDTNGKTKQFNDFEVYSFSNTINIDFNGSRMQRIATLTDGKNYEYVINGEFRETTGYIQTNSELQVHIKDLYGQTISGVTPTIINRDINIFNVKLEFDDVIAKYPSNFYLEFTNDDYPEWSSRLIFSLYVETDVNKIWKCSFNFEESTATLNSCICTDKEIIVPDTILYNGEQYKIVRISSMAFYQNSNLESIIIGDNVQYVVSDAILKCSNLKKIQIGKNAQIKWTSTDPLVFILCPQIETITIDPKNPYISSGNSNCIIDITNNVLIKASNSTTVIPNNVEKIMPGAYQYLVSIKTVTIPDTVKTIGNYAFEKCLSLENVIFSGTPILENIGSFAFARCPTLSSITLPNSLRIIGQNAFIMCESLSQVTFPNNIEAIGANSFSGCDSLSGEITIPASVTSIGTNPFAACNNLTGLKVDGSNQNYFSNDGTQECNCIFSKPTDDTRYIISGIASSLIPKNSIIGEYSFSGITALKTFDFQNVFYIDSHAFENCIELEEITNLNNLYFIDAYAFDECAKLNNITFENNSRLRKISKSCFNSCSSLTDITLPNSIFKIDDNAFANCTSLESITIPQTVLSIEAFAFLSCFALKTINFGENPNLTTIGGHCFANCTSLESITIPQTVSSINNYSFNLCYSLKTINFGENSNLHEIGQSAFAECISMESITIPKNVENINSYAFENCISLNSAIFENVDNWWSQDKQISPDDLKDEKKAAEILLLCYPLINQSK